MKKLFGVAVIVFGVASVVGIGIPVVAHNLAVARAFWFGGQP